MDNHSAAIISGLYVLIFSTLGIFFNFSVLFHFIRLPYSNFFLLCISKCISNLAVLLIYLLYIAPTCLLFHVIGGDFLNKYFNQGIAYGLYLLGPMTQLLISIDRFLVVFSGTYQVSKTAYSNRITVVAIGITWLFAGYFSVMIGFDDSCLTRFSIIQLTWLDTECTFHEDQYFFIIIMIMGGVSNVLNVLIAVKLVLSQKSASSSSRSQQKRRKRTKKFFVQSCIQDWIYGFNLWNDKYLIPYFDFQQVFIGFIMNMGSDVQVQGIDGLIMFLFNWEQMRKRGRAVNSNNNCVF